MREKRVGKGQEGRGVARRAMEKGLGMGKRNVSFCDLLMNS